MLKNVEWTEARDLLLSLAAPVETETVPLEKCAGRVLAFDLRAEEDVPPFDRSAYDGYAMRSSDIASADRDHPVTLRITETVAAGKVPLFAVGAGEAAHLMTGAKIPEGADCVIMFEKTAFTEESVTVFIPLRPGDNVVRRGEDVVRGTLLAPCGTVIDPGLAGTLASQGVASVRVFRRPRIGLITTGSEVVDADQTPEPGQIRDANRAVLTALRRTEANGFSVQDAHTLDELRACTPEQIAALVLPIDRVLSAYPAVTVTEKQAVRFDNGGALDLIRVRGVDGEGLYRVYEPAGRFLGLGEVHPEQNELAVRRRLVER